MYIIDLKQILDLLRRKLEEKWPGIMGCPLIDKIWEEGPHTVIEGGFYGQGDHEGQSHRFKAVFNSCHHTFIELEEVK